MRTIKYRGKGVYDDLWWVGDLFERIKNGLWKYI